MFGFLAGVRNYSGITPISEQRGIPSNTGSIDGLGEHSFSWLWIDELLNFDYDQEMEDRRVTVQIKPNVWDSGHTCEPGQGRKTTYRDFLGSGFFADLVKLRELGAERVVFGFDS